MYNDFAKEQNVIFFILHINVIYSKFLFNYVYYMCVYGIKYVIIMKINEIFEFN